MLDLNKLSKLIDFDKRVFLCVLDTAYGSSISQQWFPINPYNYSGRRLYRLLESSNPILVTDSCQFFTYSAREHGKPDPAWLLSNLSQITGEWEKSTVVICGAVALSTYVRTYYEYNGNMFIIPHPAARTWKNSVMNYVTEFVRENTVGQFRLVGDNYETLHTI